MSSLGLIETKNEEKVKQKLFSYHQVKNQFGHFGGPNPIFFFFGDCSLKKYEGHIFWEKKIILRSLWFFEIKNFATRDPIRRLFFIGLLKINLICSIVPVFENRKKCYITPPYWTGCLLSSYGWLAAQLDNWKNQVECAVYCSIV